MKTIIFLLAFAVALAVSVAWLGGFISFLSFAITTAVCLLIGYITQP